MHYVVWGARGHGLVVATAMVRLGHGLPELFVDNDESVESPFDAVPVRHAMVGLERWLSQRPDPGESLHSIIAIGGGGGRFRLEISTTLLDRFGIDPVTVVDPSAVVTGSNSIGVGCQLLAGSILQAGAALGRQCIINSGAIVEHECEIGDGVHIGPGAVLTGLVRVGARSFVGAGATVLPRVSIGADVVVGAGAVVVRDVPDGVTVAGVPARVMRRA